MTIAEFLEQCRAGVWRFLDDAGAVADDNDHCPIMSIATEAGWEGTEYDDDGNFVSDENYTVDDAAKFLGLSERDKSAIMRAADSIVSTRLRKRLLEACNLGGPGPAGLNEAGPHGGS